MKLTSACSLMGLMALASCGGAFVSETGTDGGAGNSSNTGDSGMTSGTTGVGGDIILMGGTGGSAGSSSGFGGDFVDTGGSMGVGGAAGGSVDAGSDWAACSGPGQCVAIAASCCGACGTAQVSAYVGVNQSAVNAYRAEKCAEPTACPAIACLTSINSNVAARCTAGRCEAFDVRQVSTYSACQLDSDCLVWPELACCSCSGSVGVSKTGAPILTRDMCATDQVCAACPAPPTGTVPLCVDKVCQVTRLVP